MIKKHYYSWTDVERMCVSIVNQMYKDNWRPDYIVGITRGGNVPATIISNMTGIRCEALKVSLRDDEQGPESNCWMAEDAFGCVPEELQETYKSRWDPALRKNILIVDDINDSGATIAWIKKDWPSGIYAEEQAWDTVCGGNVKFAVLVENLSSGETTNFSALEVNKAEHNVWLDFAWEDWWEKE
mgnify:CR=1 FL=1